ncbi:hypothetical protein PUNSTDRAFT_129406 [Punctularia strigosozonata HHB-11173 SS5]|uniref:uncharacterized protein n=1 Tax=Punctularia strigosozonata (strain HHB-11173) TaxID=741275 RepID=UPI0004417756|nr:uncharacterized protein PUNSTDRAFT_129406 [Punctularia strigosozonata HHB-11173 SS5]EIN13730.1 hypothetical protein PUNSTDRAFT_129406 [Punctularia strigosozonata HHB-11173 SS5]
MDKWAATNFCKCEYTPLSAELNTANKTIAGICFGSNYTILKLDIPDDPSKPCLSCNKQWCLNQNLPICVNATLGDTNPDTGTGKEGDVEARCFQRDSPRDQLVVTLYLLTVFGLLLGAGIKGKMIKAGLDTSMPLKWWEAWLPWRQARGTAVGLGDRRYSRSRERSDYIALHTNEG